MDPVSGITDATSQLLPASQPTDSIEDPLGALGLDDFLQLMITELQNQDPLEPKENADILAQIGSIREIETTKSLQSALETVVLSQNVASASGLIGKFVRGLTDTEGDQGAEFIEGQVDRVTIVDGAPTLHVNVERLDSDGNPTGQFELREVSLNNVSEIQDNES